LNDDLLLTLPILIPASTAVLTLLALRARRLQRVLGLAGSAALLIAALALLQAVLTGGILVSQPGGWPAPFGVTLVADTLSAVMVALAAITGLSVTLYALGSPDAEGETAGRDPPYQIMMMGVCGAFVAGDVFNLYVWFEVLLIASFVLSALGGGRLRTEGAIKYVVLNLLASTVLLIAVGLLYGLVGTLNMADAARKIAHVPTRGLVTACSMLFLVAFGIKAAVFPLFSWLPDSYPALPIPISAIFGGLLTKVGVYALIRVFTLLFADDAGLTHSLILILSALTMITGVLGTVIQDELRKILSFHIVSQIGYMGMGLGLFSRAGVAGAIFFIVHIVLVKTNLFLLAGAVRSVLGTERLAQLGGLYRTHPGLSALLLVSALSLAGLPPLSGFFAKLAIVRAGLEAEQHLLVATALLVSLLTLFSMLKIWNEAFWKELPAGAGPRSAHSGRRGLGAPAVAPAVALAVLIVLVGLAAGPLFSVCLRAADELLNPDAYIAAVLGRGVWGGDAGASGEHSSPPFGVAPASPLHR
jgi:multicomponent Na+:H+ antiporter subunit D